jgi:hypothetical protein
VLLVDGVVVFNCLTFSPTRCARTVPVGHRNSPGVGSHPFEKRTVLMVGH